MALPEWDNNGPARYDYAINGIPFYSMSTGNFPYVRQTLTSRKEQIDTTSEVGEQSLQGWWYRSQSSFDFGAGINFFDPGQDKSLSRRFTDSCGVEVFNEGQVTLLNKSLLTKSTTGHARLAPYATTGANGVLVADGDQLYAISAAGVSTTITWGGADTIADLVTDGGAWYAVSPSGVYRGVLPSSSGTKIYEFEETYTRFTLDYIKEFLFITGNEYSWAASPTPTVLPTELKEDYIDDVTASGELGYIYKYHNSSWTWTSAAGGPNAIFGAGYSGDISYIYATTVDTSTKKAEFTFPYVVAEMPPGETILSMISYLGTYIVIGTNKGVRVGFIEGDRLTIGSLTIESDGDVYSLMARDNYVYASGAKCVDHAGTARVGMYKIDLAQLTTDNLTFAWSKHLYGNATTWASTSHLCSIVPIGFTERIAFGVHGAGLFYESTGEKVDNGWLETGRIRFDTAEDKIFQYIRVNTLSVDGNMIIQYKPENSATYITLATYDTDAIRTYDTEASDGEPHVWASYKFVLGRGNAANTSTPFLLNYQLKGQPANIVQRAIKLTLMCFQREKGVGQRVIERPVWDRVNAIEDYEKKGAVVRFQDFNTGEERYAIIEQVQFVADTVADSPQGRENLGGKLLVTLRTVS